LVEIDGDKRYREGYYIDGFPYHFETAIEDLTNWDFLGERILLPQKAAQFLSFVDAYLFRRTILVVTI